MNPANPYRVRIATLADEDELMRHAVELHRENGIARISIDKVRRELRASLEQENGLIGTVGDDDGIHGSVWLLFVQEWYSEEFSINERWNYVRPQYRRTTASHDLIAWTRIVQEKCGVPLHIGIFSNSRTEAKVRLYRRQLGEPAGAFFLVGATTGCGDRARELQEAQ